MAEQSAANTVEHKTLNDDPIVVTDAVNVLYGQFTQRIVDEIEASTPPKTVAITGDWGSGKTSALASVYEQLTNKKPALSSTKPRIESLGKPCSWRNCSNPFLL